MHWSSQANSIPCLKCGTNNAVSKWPKNGDYVGWYCEDKPGNHFIEVKCSKCGRVFYVNWDGNPGPMMELD